MTRKIGVAVVILAALAAVIGPWVVPFDPIVQDLSQRLNGPSVTHPLGLDELGRDVLARLLTGARVSLLVGLAVVSVSATLGTTIGAVAGYTGGWVDEVAGRVMDILLAFPGILLAIALVAVLGPSLTNVVLALSVIGWVGYARLVRGQVLKIRELEYVHRWWCRRHSAWQAQSSRRHLSAFWGWASNRRRRAGARCSMRVDHICSTRHISRSFQDWRSRRWCWRSTLLESRYATVWIRELPERPRQTLQFETARIQLARPCECQPSSVMVAGLPSRSRKQRERRRVRPALMDRGRQRLCGRRPVPGGQRQGPETPHPGGPDRRRSRVALNRIQP
jgi:hypothetical protein